MAYAVWITGIPGAGKSTIAKKLALRTPIKILRLDEFRKKIVEKPEYTPEEREYVYTELAKHGAQLVEQNKNIIFDATDNLGIGRTKARELIKNFAVIQLECTIETAEQREHTRKDNAGMHNLYERAHKGEIKLPGLNEKYFKEEKPEITINTEHANPERAV